MGEKILVIEDDISINDILVTTLRSEGFNVKGVFNIKDAKNMLLNFDPNLALLDINLPDGNGFDLCKSINQTHSIPIIMLTARTDIVDKILGLELGADDYITKPFHIKEILTRVRIALRRVEKYKGVSSANYYEINKNIKISLKSRTVLKNDEEVKLKPREYELLEFLIQNRNRVFSREELLDNIWNFDFDGDIRTVDVHIRRLRKKLDNDGSQSIIETVFGLGYVMRG
ncbi:MAG: response regulator transcription factor [Clostridium sp.]